MLRKSASIFKIDCLHFCVAKSRFQSSLSLLKKWEIEYDLIICRHDVTGSFFEIIFLLYCVKSLTQVSCQFRFLLRSYDRFCMYQTDIYFFNNGNNRTMCEMFSIVNDVVIVSLSLTLNRFHILLWCFCCWL